MDNRYFTGQKRYVAIRLDDYARKHQTRIRRAWFAIIIASTLAFAGMLYASTGDGALSILLATPFFALQVLSLILILPVALAPVDILSRAITHVSGRTTAVVPPNLNGTRHVKTGLKDMVDTIYKIATEIDDSHSATNDEKDVALLRELVRTLPVGIIALDSKHTILYANQAAPTINDDTGHQSIQLMFEGDDTLDKWLSTVVNRSISETKQWQHVQNLLPGDDKRKVYDVLAQYTANAPSGIEVMLITSNKTEHYTQSEDDMDFISLAAHELRGPITVIHGYLDVLEDELKSQLAADQIALFERMRVSAARLTGYINNILNVARYDRRHLNLRLQEDTLHAIYGIVKEDIHLRASTQNRLLQVTIPEDLPTIAADRNSLSEVLANLIDNAIKYSHEGGLVQVTAAVDGDFVKCSVQDKGIGMPSSVISGLFTKFYRSHRTQQNFSGTGLGLYISKAIVESHGGSIGVRSKEGEGSIFTFSVPIYTTVAEKLKSNNNSNQGIINSGGGWIKNHNMYEG